jgi:hypothetical protein
VIDCVGYLLFRAFHRRLDISVRVLACVGFGDRPLARGGPRTRSSRPLPAGDLLIVWFAVRSLWITVAVRCLSVVGIVLLVSIGSVALPHTT